MLNNIFSHKNLIRRIFHISLFLFCISILVIGYSNELDLESNNKNHRNTAININQYRTPKLAGNYGPIQISSDQELDAFPNKTGDGTASTPYVIKDLIIDSGTTFQIYIRNTRQYLTFQNCTVIGSIANTGASGVLLSNITNVKLVNITATSNYYGIRIFNSSDIVIQRCNSSANILTTSPSDWYSGLYVYQSHNVHILDNIFHTNTKGLTIPSSPYYENITIQNNSIKYSRYQGIYVTNIQHLFFINNTLEENGLYLQNYNTNFYGSYIVDMNFSQNIFNDYIGMKFYYCRNLIFDNNDLTCIGPTNTFAALIYLEVASNVEITHNNFIQPAGAGVDARDIENLDIIDNLFDSGTHGVYITRNMTHSIISYNTIKNCTQIGCYIYNSSYNTISVNTVTLNGRAASGNRGGLYLAKCNNNSIIDNEITFNEYDGIMLTDNSYNNTISYNTISGNRRSYGVAIFNGPNTQIDHNTISDTYIGQIFDEGSAGDGLILGLASNSIISNNIFENNSHRAIKAYSSNNLVLRLNQIRNNHDDGVKIEYCSFPLIELNNFTLNEGNGFLCTWTSNINITRNNFTQNAKYGFSYMLLNQMQIYLNQFRNNTFGPAQVMYGMDTFGIFWNYWDDYTSKYPNATSVNGVVWDIPYEIEDSNVFDYYPLVEPRLTPLSVPSAPQWNISDSIKTYEDRIVLNWTTISSATSYRLYMNNTNVGSYLTNSCVYFFNGWGEFRFYVTAVNDTGESLQSNLISVFRYVNTTNQFGWEQLWINVNSSHDDLSGPSAAVWSNGDAIFTVSSTQTFLGTAAAQILFAKWNLTGGLVWNNTWNNSTLVCMGLDIWGDSDWIYLCGVARIPDSMNHAQVVLKIDPESGVVLWSNIYNTTGKILQIEIISTKSGIYTTAKIEDDSEIPLLQLIKWNHTSGEVINTLQMNSTDWEDFVDLEDLWSDGTNIYLAIKYSPADYDGLRGNVMKLDPITLNATWSTLFAKSYFDSVLTIGGYHDKLYVVGLNEGIPTNYTLDAQSGTVLVNGTMESLGPTYLIPRHMIVNEDFIFVVGESSILDIYSEDEEDGGYLRYPMIYRFDHNWNPAEPLIFAQAGDSPHQTFYGLAVVKNGLFGLIKDYAEDMDTLTILYNLTLVRYNFEPPSIPVFVTLDQTISPGSLTIVWKAVFGVSSYDIYINGQIYQTVNSTSITLQFEVVGTYKIQIRAKNSMGESALSIPLMITVKKVANFGWIVDLSFLVALVGILAVSSFPFSKFRRGGRTEKALQTEGDNSQKKNLPPPEPIPPKNPITPKMTKKTSQKKSTKGKTV